ncbi:hypothetical protein ACFQS7_30020 [Dankookia sp. GCM10030260]|uniref:hypothetical protein n=1 Tax=Dankookia sp. GCM10030260 TaxID=3273390 RepID=UPI0036117144
MTCDEDGSLDLSDDSEAMDAAADRYRVRFGMLPPPFEFMGWERELTRELDAAVERGEPLTTEEIYQRLGISGLPPDAIL